jgi:hypothetical protein
MNPLPLPPRAILPGIPRCQCGAARSRNHLVCFRCWQAVPMSLRSALAQANTTGNLDQMAAAKRRIFESVQNRFQPSTTPQLINDRQPHSH